MKRLRLALSVLTISAATALFAHGVGAEVVERGGLRIAVEGDLSPNRLPRSGAAPVAVSIGARISSTDGAVPPQLRRISIAINSNGHLDPGALPACQLEQIQPATTAGALEACRASLVGTGSFSAEVLLPEQAPFPSSGEVFAFNGTVDGRPAILAHVYGTEPAPTSVTLAFLITRTRGTYGTLLRASLPRAASKWGYVTGLELNLARRPTQGGRGGYATAGCPAPRGFPGAVFTFARTSFDFAGGIALTQSLVRGCRAGR